MGEICLFLLQWFGEFLLEVLLDGLGEVLWGIFKAEFKRPDRHYPVALLGFAVFGIVLGAISVIAWPERVLHRGPVPGVSLVLAPLGAGAVMHLWGVYGRGRGLPMTRIATFWGGAVLALGVAVVRFVATM